MFKEARGDYSKETVELYVNRALADFQLGCDLLTEEILFE